jgi:orotidine-5'-phosphate decarboxylase
MQQPSNWIPRELQPQVVRFLLRYGLLKFDNARRLPLKKGGFTDVYINLRDARNHAASLAYLAKLYAAPLRQLGVSRFVEVPAAVSCFAGPLAIETGIPYLTIRDVAKTGRVGDAESIGQAQFGEDVVTIDDVITDGKSKIDPHYKVLALGLNHLGIVVLVNRQQGWPEHLRSVGIELPVYAGMTLHDVRRCLIQDLGVMQRCDPKVEEENNIILALDGKDWDELLPTLDELRTSGVILKVNDLMFDEGFRHLLPELSVYGRVMVDIKNHDIKQTVINTCKRLVPHNPWAVTVHASGDIEMVATACATLRGCDTKVLAVSVLTSIGEEGCMRVFGRKPKAQVLRLAKLVRDTGAHGLVCSPEEITLLRSRSEFDDMLLVTPGVRSPGAVTHDQLRTDTPAGAIRNGSNYIVVGREVMESAHPIAALAKIRGDIAELS